ncbi:hypothetical protein WOLCODRAFT_139293 [Wolfiporia cocos MD-104 SS10]|uniref:Uncharacterized protein n=1 Tax=Wolfiporia cocos (strain MD-104) TaxID=742152 RepID=A0A2H3K721_WOLCO|nr:hypothetical protein WOLCODRAFT_139293 [Wolfiporia cocos MD-104 SS10]
MYTALYNSSASSASWPMVAGAPTLQASAPMITNNGASYLRITAISIAAYDFIMTLPAEWRFYKCQKSWRVSPGCLLFILMRYISVIALTTSSVGYFGVFSAGECKHYFIVGAIFKVVQTMVSQIILGIRTLNIARRATLVTWVLPILFVLVIVAEWITNLYGIQYAQSDAHNCIGADNVRHLYAWIYYVVAIFYDLSTLTVSTFYLLRYTPPSGRLTRLMKLMLYDGVGSFVVITAMNILNLILFHTTDELTQSAGACLGETVTWIMSQRILIHLRDAAAEHHRTVHHVSHPLHSPRSVSRAMRSVYTEDKSRLDEEYDLSAPPEGQSATDLDADMVRGLSDVELDVHVQVTRSITVECDADAEACRERALASFCAPRVVWGGDATPRTKDDSSG